MICVQVTLWPGTEEGSERPPWWQISTLVADHGEGIPREAGGGEALRVSREWHLLKCHSRTSLCASVRLHGCISIWASAGFTSASSMQTHLPDQGSQEKGVRGRLGRVGLLSHPVNSTGPARRLHSRVFPGIPSPSWDPGQKLHQLSHVPTPGPLLQQSHHLLPQSRLPLALCELRPHSTACSESSPLRPPAFSPNV